jgi:hypothetical protein
VAVEAEVGGDALAELLVPHLQADEEDPLLAVALLVLPAGDPEPVAGAEHGLAHAGAAGDDDELGRLDRAELRVEAFDAAEDAGLHAVRLDRRRSSPWRR